MIIIDDALLKLIYQNTYNLHYLFYLGHPAHFHLFKNTINSLLSKGNKLSVLIKKKDILEDLLLRSNMNFRNILPEGRKDSKTGIAWGVIKRDWRLLRYCISNRPDIMIGTSAEIGHVGTLLNIPSLNVNEDDATVVPLFSKISYPWNSLILSPTVCSNGKWENKSIKYEGYHELAYLHPNHFIPSKEIVNKYLPADKQYFLIRFARLNAHHDTGIRGISTKVAAELIDRLKPAGEVYITSERDLEPEFQPYRISINPTDIHHVMAFAQLYIGDSQTMAAEAGVLGVPFLRFNDFVGKISYLKELEDKYKLGYGINPSYPELLHKRVEELIQMKDRQNIFQDRRRKMLDDKIDVSKFLSWFIENYPTSVQIMRNKPEYQFNFR